jgi:hypothetical protein
MSDSEPKLIQDARSLSSGFLAGLIGDTRYTVIDAVQFDFVEFCQENLHYLTWVAAWNDFKQVYNFEQTKADPLERFRRKA